VLVLEWALVLGQAQAQVLVPVLVSVLVVGQVLESVVP